MSAPSRRWLELRARVHDDPDAVGLLAEELVGMGGRAVEERDGWLVTHLPERGDLAAFRTRARERLRLATGSDALELELDWQPHEEWAETWRRGLAARRITDRLVVRPSWVPFPEARPGDRVIVLDPGMAFGTAEHGTTRGCLRLLDEAVRAGDRILDVGAGSGILSIAAILVGAEAVHAVEMDELACEALAANVEANDAAGRVRWTREQVDSEWLERAGPVDGVVANIEAGVLRPLLPGFRAALNPGGWLILSGLLGDEWPGMRGRAERAGFYGVRVDEDAEWRSGLFRVV